MIWSQDLDSGLRGRALGVWVGHVGVQGGSVILGLRRSFQS